MAIKSKYVNVKTLSETHLELEWNNADNKKYNYTLKKGNEPEVDITGSDHGTNVTHNVSSLLPGTEYSFTLFTVFEGVRSPGYTFSAANVATRSETHLELEWTKVNNDNNYNYVLRDSNGAETSITGSDAGTTVNVANRSETHLELEWTKVNNYNYILKDSSGAETSIPGSDAGTTVKHTLSSLSAGTKYSFTLFTVFEEVSSTGHNFSAVTVPPDVTQVNVVNRSETHLELEWTKVNNYNYILKDSSGEETSIPGSDAGTTVKHTLSPLSAGTKYSFTLFTVFEGVRSTGHNFSAVTAPSNVRLVNVVNHSETDLELEWNKVNNNRNYNYILRDSNGAETSITGSDAGTTVKHTVSSLSAGTKYSFTLFTVFEGVRSTGHNFSAVTVPPDVTQVNVVNRSETHLELEWTKVNNYNYILKDSSGAETSIPGSDAGTTVKHTLSPLSAGTKYSFTLFTVFEGVRSTGHNFSAVTAPSNVRLVNVVNHSETDLELEWNKVNNNRNYNYILRDSNGAETSITGSDAGTTVNVVNRSETHLELEWTKVNNYNYILKDSSGAETSIPGSDAGTTLPLMFVW
ncbi:receptor-type tyrosine-protein phosphatase eta-like [Alosa pseudoharengus]|uniref:receptor-type tyrosine-protein phosphatase eta-like n=1 Tax=Alosa pseudoharengus TaxID=34774 RepID=UPI003F88B4B2